VILIVISICPKRHKEISLSKFHSFERYYERSNYNSQTGQCHTHFTLINQPLGPQLTPNHDQEPLEGKGCKQIWCDSVSA
jgi:hypothetical protein